MLREVAALVREHADELAEPVAREVGKPRRETLAGVRHIRVDADFGFDDDAGIAGDRPWRRTPTRDLVEARVAYEPYAGAAAILPFNWSADPLRQECARPRWRCGTRWWSSCSKQGAADGAAPGRAGEPRSSSARHCQCRERHPRPGGPQPVILRAWATNSLFTGATATGLKALEQRSEET